MKRLLSLILILSLSLGTWADDKQLRIINDIKKSREYLYGDATMGTLQEATSLAYELLQKEVLNWASERTDSPIKSISPMDINRLADTIVTRRADMFRVFAYVKKVKLNAMFYDNGIAYLDSLDFGKITNPDSRIMEEQKQGEQQEITVSDDALKQIHSQFFNKPASGKESHTSATPSSGKESNSSARPSTSRESRSSARPSVENESRPSVRPSIGEEQLGTVAKKVIARIKKARNFFDLKNVLPQLKQEGLISNYGKLATAENLEECFLIVYDAAGNIKALLGKGIETRPNLNTGATDKLENYRGCGALWFKIK